MGGDQLPSWHEGPAKRSVVEFVSAVTDPGSADFAAEPERIAVFDNDGTLRTEQPMYAQLAFALDRAAELGHPRSRRRAQVDRDRHGRGLDGGLPAASVNPCERRWLRREWPNA